MTNLSYTATIMEALFYSIMKKRSDTLCKKKLVSSLALTILGSAILSFGLYQVHALSGVTEGGVLGLTLFLHHWLSLSPALSGLILNGLCYAMGLKLLGTRFLAYSILAGGSFSAFYAIWEQYPPLWPQLAQEPILAAVLGGLFVGVGAGLSVRAGGAPSGDDALAMSLSKWTGWKIQWLYLISDLVVLALSATYIPPFRLLCSLFTVILSGQLIGLIQRIPSPNAPPSDAIE